MGYTNDISTDQLQDVLRECQDTNEKFSDQQFKPDKSSLIKDWNEDHEEVRDAKADKWSEIEWKRADEIHQLNDAEEGKLALFQKGKDGTGEVGIEPNDIQ